MNWLVWVTPSTAPPGFVPEDWLAGLRSAAFAVALEQKLRTSCCYVYVLPNVNACTTCPRFG